MLILGLKYCSAATFGPFRGGQFSTKKVAVKDFLRKIIQCFIRTPLALEQKQPPQCSKIFRIRHRTPGYGNPTTWGETLDFGDFCGKITEFQCFAPRNPGFALFGLDLGGDPDGDDRRPSDFLMAATTVSTIRRFPMQFYSIEVIYMHVTFAREYHCYIFFRFFVHSPCLRHQRQGF